MVPQPQQPSYDQVSRRASRSPAWFGQLIMFSVTLFILALVGYLGIVFGFRPYLESRVNTLDEEIQAFSQQVPADEQARIATFYSQIANLRTLLNKHTTTSAFLTWLERATVTRVQISKVNVNLNSRQIQITGLARTATDVAAQIVNFQNQPGVERVDFRNTSEAANGLIQFNANITVVAGFFTATALNISNSSASSESAPSTPESTSTSTPPVTP